jgi:hypothetical protein
MDATCRYCDGGADYGAQTLIFQPELLSQGDMQALCHSALAKAEDVGDSSGDRGLTSDDRGLCSQSLQTLGRLAVVGSHAHDFADWPWYSRRPARLAARCIVFLSWFLVSRQNKFNAASLNVLHDFAQQLVRNQARDARAVQRAEQRLQEQIDALEARIAALQFELVRARSAEAAA